MCFPVKIFKNNFFRTPLVAVSVLTILSIRPVQVYCFFAMVSSTFRFTNLLITYTELHNVTWFLDQSATNSISSTAFVYTSKMF